MTQPSQAQHELQQATERYRAFVANSSEGIWRCEMEQPIPTSLPPDQFIEQAYRYGRIAECNDAMVRMYGFDTSEQIIGARLDALLVREDTKNQDHLRAFIASGLRLLDAESHMVDRDGRHKYFINDLVGVIENGKLVRVWGTQRDITQQKQVQEQLRQSAEVAEAGNRAKTEFLSVLSHELRTPLTPILLMVTMLEQKLDLPADVREDLAMIRENIQLEARLIDALLDVSRITRGKLKLDLSDVGVDPLVTAEAEAARNEDAAPITVELSAAKTLVHGDKTRIGQILRALLSNAVKFTPRKGQITIRTRNPDASTLAIDVIDTGIGIERDQIERIFGIFEPPDQAARRRSGGLGLGLPVSHWLAKAHGGSLTVTSGGKDQGSTFTLNLPLK